MDDQDNGRKFVIIGGGLVGCYLASRLVDEGNEVVLIELGGSNTEDSSQATRALVPNFTTSVYRGALPGGRAFGLGGTSTIWGGAMIPPSRFEKHLSPSFDDSVQRAVLEKFGVHGHFYSTQISENVDKRNVLWPSFTKKNARRLIDTKSPNLKLLLNTQVLKLAHQDGRIIGLKLRKSDAEFDFDSSMYTVIMAAGMIESTRLLLASSLVKRDLGESREQAVLHSAPDSIETTFSDHISAPIATLTPLSEQYLNHLVKGRHWGLESVRYDYKFGECTGFLNIQFTRESSDPFYALRQLLLSLQSGVLGRDSLKHFLTIIKSFNWFFVFASYFLRKGLVLPPPKSKIFINLVATKFEYGTISFKDESINLDWEITDKDREYFLRAARSLLNEIALEFEGVFSIDRHTDSQITEELGKDAEVFHPNGSFPFGFADAVVTEDLKLKGCDNMYLISSGLFPNGGVSSPSFSLLCLAEKLVRSDRICSSRARV